MLLVLCGHSSAAINPLPASTNLMKVSAELITQSKCSTYNLISATENLAEIEDFKNEVLRKVQVAVNVADNNHLNSSTKPLKSCSMFVIDSMKGFMKLYGKLSPDTFNFSGRFVVVLIRGKIPEYPDIFKLMWKLQIVNVEVMFEEPNGDIPYYTFMPFNEGICKNTKPILVKTFKDGKFIQLLLMKKYANLNQCPVQVATSINPPYVIQQKLANGSFHYYGRVIEMLNALQESLNFKVNISCVGQGNVFENGSAAGSFKEVMEGRADMVLGDTWLRISRLKYFDTSQPYFSQFIVFIVPPALELSSIEKLILPFSAGVWCMILMNVIARTIIKCFISKFKLRKLDALTYGCNQENFYLSLFRGMIGSSQPKLPKGNFARFVLMMFLLKFLVLRAAYQSAMFEMMRSNQKHKEPQTIDEMFDRNYKLYLHPNYKDFIIDEQIRDRVTFFGMNEERHYIDQTRDPTFKGAVLRSYLAYLYENFMKFKANRTLPLKACKEKFLTANSVIYYSKNFYLKQIIDEKIRIFQTAGLINFWHSKLIDEKYVEKALKETKPAKTLTMEKLLGIFQIWIAGCSMSIIAFVIEIVRKFFKCC